MKIRNEDANELLMFFSKSHTQIIIHIDLTCTILVYQNRLIEVSTVLKYREDVAHVFCFLHCYTCTENMKLWQPVTVHLGKEERGGELMNKF